MFEGFAHIWTPAVLASRVRRKPVRMVIAGEAIVFFRTPDGGISALMDRCPHRAASLSLGRVTAEGCLECPFHGWRFDAAGRNVHVPLNPDARRDRLHAKALPVRLIGDFVWIYTAPGVAAPEEPMAPDGLSDPGLVRTYVERDWACHWTRAMENMLDSSHVPFVHGRTIGKANRRRMTPGSRMEISWAETQSGGRASARLDAAASPVFLEFWRPNIMALHIPIPGRHFRIHAIVVPTEGGRTRLTVAGSRDFARLRILNPWFSRMNGRIADEDKAVVESSGPAEVPPAGLEPSVETDRATLQFRKYYYETLRPSSA